MISIPLTPTALPMTIAVVVENVLSVLVAAVGVGCMFCVWVLMFVGGLVTAISGIVVWFVWFSEVVVCVFV